jgi:hypothetical protein
VAFPRGAGIAVTLSVHNIALFFVLASRTRKNTSTPPLGFQITKKTWFLDSSEYNKHFELLPLGL